MEPQLLDGVISTLFPVIRDVSTITFTNASPDWSDELEVTDVELKRTIDRLKAHNTAPGPDGIPGRAWMLSLTVLDGRLRRLFTNCLRLSIFPSIWKEAKLVLVRKSGKTGNSASSFRPICLLDEVSKLFERIIADRLSKHLARVGPDLSHSQYGFREGKSTLDAILCVRTLSEQALSRGGVALAVSLDIVNAFNSLPWAAIREGLIFHCVPPYLQRIIGAYLHDRHIQFMGRDGLERREMTCGVPQGSVLGPILWNLAYDAVLRVTLPVGVSAICYADDTLILASGSSFSRASSLAELGVGYIVTKIHELGLQVAPHKTEALWFHELPRGRKPPCSSLRVGGTHVQIGRCIKYLGLTLDSRWRFEEHFRSLTPRIERVIGALHRLLPNLGGPKEEVRRLYAGVVRPMALYGAPVWSNRLSSIRRLRLQLNRVQRKIAIRVVRGYRTISFDAATLLARFPPLDILAEMETRMFNINRNIPRPQDSDNVHSTPVENVRRQELKSALEKWQQRLQEPNIARQRTVEAILPCFEAWLKREGHITFRLAQVFTGHGCFGEYLSRIGRETSAQCHYCNKDVDSAQHTLAMCPAWDSERQDLVNCAGQDLSLSAIVAAMLKEKSVWKAMVAFCEDVMSKKERDERDREKTGPSRIVNSGRRVVAR